MAKILVRTRNDGIRIETHEDIFKISNRLEKEITINCTDTIFDKIKEQTFYITFDIVNNPNDVQAFNLYSDLFPTPIFKDAEENITFGACRHVLSNVLHYSNPLIAPFEDALRDIFPKNWDLKFIDDADNPIGNDIIPHYFNYTTNLRLATYIEFSAKFDNQLPRMTIRDELKYENLNQLLNYVYAPATHYDPESYNYKISRREIGKLVRDQAFKMVSGHIHLIGPETESVQNVVKYLQHKDNTITFYTFDSSKKTTYEIERGYVSKMALEFQHLLAPQRKNQNNFLKGLIRHINRKGTKIDKVYYIGSYPSYWLETMKWIDFQIVCYDPKFRNVDNDHVIWRDRIFDYADINDVQDGSYVYIDIRTDSRDNPNRERILHDEDEFIFKISTELIKKKCTVMAKRKIFDGMNTYYGELCFPPKVNQLGREYYMLSNDLEIHTAPSTKLYAMLLSARHNNVANYIFGGQPFTEKSEVSESSVIIALYSISNTINSLKLIEFVVKHNHIITFPVEVTTNDWRELKQGKSMPFPSKVVEQEIFTDWTVDPKVYALKFNKEILSESVFLQHGKGRAFIPDLYNHMISINLKLPLFYSDRFFSHIGIRQPSVFARDNYMTSRISAYITRQLTHSIDLTVLEKNKFAGYSGHLIAVEMFFNSLVYTMSPYRWLLRAKRNLVEYRKDKFTIGKGDPHDAQEFANTYEYLYENDLARMTFKNLLLGTDLQNG